MCPNQVQWSRPDGVTVKYSALYQDWPDQREGQYIEPESNCNTVRAAPPGLIRTHALLWMYQFFLMLMIQVLIAL